MGIKADLSWVGRQVTYHGKNRKYLFDKLLTVTEVARAGYSVALWVPNTLGTGTEEWCAAECLKLVPLASDVQAVSDDLLDPYATALEGLDAQIKIHEDKLRELRAARQVIAGL